MKDLLQATIDEGASDLHIRAFMPPELRVHGELVPIADEAFQAADTESLCRELCTPEQFNEVEHHGGADFAVSHDDGTRFRVSVFKERNRWGCVLRMIPSTLLTLEQIGLPPTVKELLFKPRGLILVTGPTGSGKSTTLASMIDVINQERGVHIITIEDPIEFYHTSKKSLITQREVGADVPSFAEAIRRALRQDPDVILVGEMRDLETISAAITAAETGHLVFGTLHTTGAAETIDRIVDSFPTDQQEQVRSSRKSSCRAPTGPDASRRSRSCSRRPPSAAASATTRPSRSDPTSRPARSSAWSRSMPAFCSISREARSPTNNSSQRPRTPSRWSPNSRKR